MPAHYFGAAVTLNTLSTRVPAGYHAIGIKPYDRVVLDALDQCAESLLASRNFNSNCLRSVTSRTELEISVPSAVSSGLRLISTGNSDPSLRRPCRLSPAPIERGRGAWE